LAVHLAVSPPANVDIAIFPSEGALAMKIAIPEISDVQRLGVSHRQKKKDIQSMDVLCS
jgi:hypothetical protein